MQEAPPHDLGTGGGPRRASRAGAPRRLLRRLGRGQAGRRTLAGAALAALAAWAGVLADGGALSAQRLDLGTENSWIRIQNVGTQPSTIEISFHDEEGSEVAVDRCPTDGVCTALRPGSGRSFFQQGFEELPLGYRGSAYVTADQPFVTLLARDAFKEGLFQIAGDTLRLAHGSNTLYAPIVQNTESYVSRLSIENTSAEQHACIEIRYYEQLSTVPAIVDPPGPTPGCANGGHRVAPRGSLVRDEHSLPVGLGFDGSAVVIALPAGDDPSGGVAGTAMMVDTRERDGPGLASYRAIDHEELSRQVVLPLVDRNASEGQSTWTTRFRILAGTPTVPTRVTVLFEGVDEAGDRFEIEQELGVNGALSCDLRFPGAGGCLPGEVTLPDVFRGTVRIQAVDPIAVVAQRLSEGGPLADYRGFTVEEASRHVLLPVLNKNFGPFGGNRGWNSWFRVLTFDGSDATLRTFYYSRQFPNGLISASLRVQRERSFRQWEDPRLPDGWVGSGLVVADRPVVVVVNLESDVFAGDPVMLYSGVSLQ